MRFSNSGFSSEEWLASTSGQSFNSDPRDDKTGDIFLASHGKTLNDSDFSAEEEGSVQVENPTCTSAFTTASVALYQSLISGFSSLNDYLLRGPTLGLKLTKSPSPTINHNSTQPIILSAEENAEKMKAGHIPISVLEIGKYRVACKHEENLVAKCYYARRKLMWEILNGNLKSKIEFNWEDILSLGAKIEPKKPGILTIELKELPSFYHEKDPQPRKHANWEQSGDFTRNQASTHRVHVLQFSPGLLDAFFQNLIGSDDRLKQLSEGPCPTLSHPYFSSNADDAYGSLTCPPAPLPPTTYQLGNHIQSPTLVHVMDNILSALRGVVNSQRVEDPATLLTRLPDPYFSSHGYDANGSLSNSCFPSIGYGARGSQSCPHSPCIGYGACGSLLRIPFPSIGHGASGSQLDPQFPSNDYNAQGSLPDWHFPSDDYNAHGSTSTYTPAPLQTTHQIRDQMQPSPPVQVMGDIIPPLHEGIYRDPNLVASSDSENSAEVGSTSSSDVFKALRDIMSSDD